MLKLTDYLYLGSAKYKEDFVGLRILEDDIIPIGGGRGPSYIDVLLSGVSPLVLTNALELNYLKLFGGTEQRNLPDNYIQRQYIYMMDGSYLLTDIVPTYDGHYELDFQTTNVGTLPCAYVGGRTTGQPAGIILSHDMNKKVIADGFGERYNSSVEFLNNTRYKYVFDNKVFTLYQAGTAVATNTFTGTDATGAALCINGINTNGTIAANVEGIYLYGFKAWNNQGQLIVDYVPAVQKGTVPIVGFYDMVAKTFKTATSGTFMAGAEAVPSPDTPMDIVCNNGVLKYNSYGLPSGYTKLEYIESSDTQYIDTGIKPDVNTKIEAIIGRNSQLITSDNGIFGTGYFGCRWASDSVLRGGFGTTDWTNTNVTQLDKNNIQFETGNFKYNSEMLSVRTGSSFGSNSILLFAITTANKSATRLYSFAIYQNNVLVRDFIPAKNSSDVVGMYDTISQTFFTNAGTGTFTAGPVEQPYIYTDGTTETVQVTGKNLFDGQWQAGIYSPSSGEYSPTNNRVCNTNMIQVEPSTTYTVSCPSYALENGMRWVFYDANKNFISAITNGATTITTPSNAKYINFYIANNLTVDTALDLQLELGSTATTYEPYFNGGTATCEDLLSVDNFTDVQSILDGIVTKKVGVHVLDGTENWTRGVAIYADIPAQNVYFGYKTCLCTHYKGVNNTQQGSALVGTYYVCIGSNANGAEYKNRMYFYPAAADFTTATEWSDWLKTQYNAGTPVIIVYPLATSTTESVTAQPLTVQTGTNIVAITQASMDGLTMEVSYMAGVTVTITEVENAQLSNNVEVTING